MEIVLFAVGRICFHIWSRRHVQPQKVSGITKTKKDWTLFVCSCMETIYNYRRRGVYEFYAGMGYLFC